MQCKIITARLSELQQATTEKMSHKLSLYKTNGFKEARFEAGLFVSVVIKF